MRWKSMLQAEEKNQNKTEINNLSDKESKVIKMVPEFRIVSGHIDNFNKEFGN